jgi:hypothetical protein
MVAANRREFVYVENEMAQRKRKTTISHRQAHPRMLGVKLKEFKGMSSPPGFY